MLLSSTIFLLFTALSAASPVQHQLQVVTEQNVLNLPHARPLQAGNPRKLRGKFLHITDVHPDPFYEQGTDPNGEHPCHAGDGNAGYFGAEKTECDSPFSLINATFDWIRHNIKDEIDFVVWTGDSARHDNDDDKYPRSNKQIEQLNRFIVDKFDDVFGKPDNRHDPDPTNDFVVPIVPTFGNNDVLPHNILEPGPNRWTRKYLSIWEKFIPQEQRHSFARGGWFFTEVIPNKLAVFSLNTLYFFESNAAVDGCDAHSEPGYEHFEWLRIQLEFLRQRNMKAILIGHVPPARTESKQNWDESCYQKYNLWLRQYRDVIVGNIFGHMNIDHFILQDVRELSYRFRIPGIDDHGLRDGLSSISDTLVSQAKSDYLVDLRQHWGNLPSPPRGSSYTGADIHVKKSREKKKREQLEKFLKEIGGPYGERFSLSVVSPSVVPNFYPTLRIIEYNITGMKHDHPALIPTAPMGSDLRGFGSQIDSDEQETMDDDLENDLDIGSDFEIAKKKKKHKKKKGKKPKPNFVIPRPPSRSSPPGPGHSPQTLSLISWSQLYANLTKINEAVAKELEFERDKTESGVDNGLQMEAMKRHFAFEVEYNTSNDSIYSMKDLTVRSWLDYAEKISRAKFTPKEIDPDTGLETEECDKSDILNGVECGDIYGAGPSLASDETSVETSASASTYEDDSNPTVVHHNHETSISSSSTDLDLIDGNGDDGEYDTSENLRISLECLVYLWKVRNSALKVYDPRDDDRRPWDLLHKLDPELMIEQCRRQPDTSKFQPDSDKDNDDESKGDSGYDSDFDSNSEPDDDTSDSGYDDSEDDDTDNNNDDASTTKHKKHKKNKHRKNKKTKKRKGFDLKNNHLWHRFVRRAFVETKTWEELQDEFG